MSESPVTSNAAVLTDDLREAAIWGMTLVQSSEYLRIAEETGIQRNRFYADRHLSKPETLATGANVETIYGYAWLDLAEGPQVLEVPATDDRYYSVQLIDAFFQTVAYVGRRTTGSGAGTFLISGPGWSGEVPTDMKHIPLPTDLAFALPRVQVCDAQAPEDEAVARKLLEGLVLGPLATYPEERIGAVVQDGATAKVFPIIDLPAMGATFFDRLCAAIPAALPANEIDQAERFARIGIASGHHPSQDPELAPLLEDAVREAVEVVRTVQPMSILGNGPWIATTALRDVGPQDPRLRSRLNIDAPGFHPAVEAIYAALLIGSDGAALTGDRAYRVRFPPGGIPPVDAFWSMTMYAVPNQRLVPNPINRCAIGSNFKTLEYGADGSLELMLQRERPEGSDANWLPAPEGQFMLLCRFYQPRQPLIEGAYSLPPAEPSRPIADDSPHAAKRRGT